MTSFALTLMLATAPNGVAQPPVPLGQPQPFPQPFPQTAPPGVLLPQPAPIHEPIPVSPLPVFHHIPSHQEFAAAFRPAPGQYKVLMLHPGKCKPVEVCFTLPPGCPKLTVTKRMIRYDYGHCRVEIRFRLFGRVTVSHV